MPIPTGTAAISFSQIRNEMNTGSGGAYTGAFSLNDATFRLRLTDTAQSTSLSLNAIRGNAYQRFTIAADYSATYNVYSALSAAPIGWNKTAKGSADVVVSPGVVVGTPSTATYAMDTGPAALWPGTSTITVINNGYIVGMGGAGAVGAPQGGNGSVGSAGGPALLARRPMKLENTGTVGGGGGGGGSGTGRSYSAPSGFPLQNPSPVPYNNGGGGGGGGQTGRTNSAGGGPGPASGGNNDPGSAGAAGTFAGGGAGGNGGTAGPTDAGDGGPGGAWGTAGGSGTPAPSPVRAGGAAGISVQGWSQVTYTSGPAPAPTGTISGPTTAG